MVRVVCNIILKSTSDTRSYRLRFAFAAETMKCCGNKSHLAAYTFGTSNAFIFGELRPKIHLCAWRAPCSAFVCPGTAGAPPEVVRSRAVCHLKHNQKATYTRYKNQHTHTHPHAHSTTACITCECSEILGAQIAKTSCVCVCVCTSTHVAYYGVFFENQTLSGAPAHAPNAHTSSRRSHEVGCWRGP